jgi:hypothetical protein
MSRLWRRIRSLLSTGDGKETEDGKPSSARPAELEDLRRRAAALCALSSRIRIELSRLLREYEEKETEVKHALQLGDETSARALLADLTGLEPLLNEHAARYEIQRRTAEAAVNFFRQKEAERKRSQSLIGRSSQPEIAAGHARPLTEPPKGKESAAPNAETSPGNGPPEKSRSAVAAAREALDRPPLSERTPP